MSEPSENAGIPKELEIHFVKGNHFRVIHADGIWGGVTPNGNIEMCFFNQRNPFPQSIKEGIIPEGETFRSTGEVVGSRTGKSGILRELEVDVVMNLQTAKVALKWLEENIKRLEQFQQ